MGLLLYILATILWIPLTVINLLFVLYINRKKRSYLRVLNGYFYQTAIDIDRFGNRNFRTLLNYTMITEYGYNFGDVRETISSVLGKNQLRGELTGLGIALANLLDWLDPNHCQKSIMDLD